MRLPGLFDDLWLDEIWSLSFAVSAKSMGQIFFGIHHDNNHYLNTLWMYLWGDQSNWFVYRLHSYAAGVATIVGVGILARDLAIACRPQRQQPVRTKGSQRSTESPLPDLSESRSLERTCFLATIFLLSTCFMACVYSTEARGYSLAGMAAVFATIVLRRAVVGASSARFSSVLPAAFIVLSMVGFLSHLTYLTVYLPHLIWSTVMFWRVRRILTFMICHGPPLLLIAVMWLFDIRIAGIGGAPLVPLIEVIPQSLALPMGIPDPDWLVLLCAAVCLIGLCVGLTFLFRHSRFDALLFGLLILVSPPILFGMRSSGLLSVRHFFVVWMTLFPLLGLCLGLIGTSIQGRGPTLLAFGSLWLATNGSEFVQFIQYGRGGFAKSVEWLVAESRKAGGTANATQSVGGNHDLRIGLVLNFYLRDVGRDAPITYYPHGRWPQGGVDWLVVQNLDRHFKPVPVFNTPFADYDLVHLERYAAPIGQHWAIYRKRGLPATVTPKP